MREVYYFQTYHQGENAHSSNALLLLKRLYLYKSKIFYKVITNWIGCDFEDITTRFYTQEKGKNKDKGQQSVLDFTISQGSFKLYVEAKEKENKFDKQQMLNHLENLKQEKAKNKVMIALAPTFSKSDEALFKELRQDFQDIKIQNLTYLDIYYQIKEELDENRDIEMLDILEEYRSYCSEENLIDDKNSIVMARSAGDTIDFNAREDVNLYFDGINHNYEGFRYIALYKNMFLRYVGKIQKILSNDGEVLLDYTDDKVISNDDIARLEKGKECLQKIYNTSEPHAFYLVDKFVPIENFEKTSKYALYGRKKFYLENYNLKPNCSAEEIAEAWKNKTW